MAYELTQPNAKMNAPAAGCGCRRVLLDEAERRRAVEVPAYEARGEHPAAGVEHVIAGVLGWLASRLPAPSEKQGGIADAEVAQAQDSTADQLRRLSAVAIERGLYDADDVLRRAREREWAQTDNLARLTAECERLRGELATVTRERDELTGERDRMRAYIDGVHLGLKGGAR